METCPEARLTMEAGMKNGEIFPGPPCKKFRVLALDDVESADAAGDIHAGIVRNFRGDFQAGHFHREIRGGNGELDEPAHLLEFFFSIQSRDRNPRTSPAMRQSNSVASKCGDRSDAAASGQQVFPGLFGADSASADQPDARNDNSTVQRRVLPVGIAAGKLFLCLGRACRYRRRRLLPW